MSYCSSCLAEFDASTGKACPHCGYLAGNTPLDKAFTVQAHRTKGPGLIKLAVAIDRTESSRAFQAGMKAILADTFTFIGNMVSKLDIDLWSYGDETCQEQPVQLVQSGDARQVLETAQGICFSGGFDIPETHATQVERLVTVTSWGVSLLGCRNVILAMMTGDTKPAASGRSMKAIGADMKAKRIKLILVAEPTQNLRDLVSAADGFLIEITNNPDSDEIKRVTNRLCATLTLPLSAGSGTIPISAVVE